MRCTHLDVCFTSMVILALSSEVDFYSSTTGDLVVFSTADLGGRFSLVATGCGRAEASIVRTEALGGVLRQPPKPALVSRTYRGLPGYFQEYLCGDRLCCLCL